MNGITCRWPDCSDEGQPIFFIIRQAHKTKTQHKLHSATITIV